MRKITILASAAGLALALSGCGETKEAAPTETAAAVEATAASSDAAPAGSDDAAAASSEEGDDRGNPGDRG